MHRRNRCPYSRYAAILAAATLALPAYAQSASEMATPDAPATPPAATQLHDRLAVHLRLGDGVRMWRPTRRQLGIAYAPGGSNRTPSFQFTINPAALTKYLNTLAPYVKRQPVNAHPIVASPNAKDQGMQAVAAKVVPDRDGAVLDVPQAVSVIEQAIKADPATVHIVLPLKLKPAKVHAADLAGINSRLGYFVTRFNPGEVGRTHNVRSAIDIINRHIVPPGGIFSVNQTVGERTAKRGFQMGHVFINGKMEKQLGGGMCQVATTLFNAAMLADLKIVERHQHVRTIPYASPGRDATVYWGQKDFRIQNDTAAPLYISYITTRNHAIASFYGKGEPGRKIKLVSHYSRLGERHYTGVFYRVVTLPDGTVKKDKPYYSAYKWTPALDFNR